MTTIANSFATKLTVAFVAIAMMISVAAPARAASDDLQSQIDDLMATIALLQAQLGVAGADAMASSSDVCPYTWTRSLNMGDTGSDVMKLQQFLNADAATQVAATGAGSAGNETEYYGPATGGAVAKFQEMYRAEILSPLGLVNSTTFFGNSTRAQANAVCVAAPVDPVDGGTDDGSTDGTDDGSTDGTDEGTDDSASLGNGEGDITNLNETAADESSLEEGLESGLLAFDFEVEGDVEVNRVDFYMDNTAAGSHSGDPSDYFNGASLLVDGDKVADLDVSDWDEDAYTFDVVTNSGDEYRLRFSGLGLVFADGDQPEFQLALDAVNNIDSADLGETWGIDMAGDSIRFVDGQGFSDTTGSTGIQEAFTFDAETIADLKVSSSSDDPKASIIEVSDTGSTDGVVAFRFEVEEKEGVDVTIEDLSVTVTTTGTTDESAVVEKAVLKLGDDILGSETVPNGGLVKFENIDLAIAGDEKEELTVELDFADADAYNEGDTVAVVFTSLDKFEDDNGNDENDITPTGSASGEAHELRTKGIRVIVDSATTNVTSVDGATNDTVEFTWNVTIEAFGDDDVYINASSSVDHIRTADSADVEVVYGIDNSGTALTSISATIVEKTGASNPAVNSATPDSGAYGAAYNGEAFFRIDSDTDSSQFTVNISGTNATDSKQVRAYLSNLEWTTDYLETATTYDGSTAVMNDYTFELKDDSETPYKTVN